MFRDFQLNNPNFTANGHVPDPNGYLSLPASILPSSGSVTIESWFTFTGSGFLLQRTGLSLTITTTRITRPVANNGEYLMQTQSPLRRAGPTQAPQAVDRTSPRLCPVMLGLSRPRLVVKSMPLAPPRESAAGGGGYLDDGETFMSAVVIDGTAGTLSYYLYDLSQGGIGGLQQTVATNPLSAFNFTNAFLGRSAFFQDNATSGSIDEFPHLQQCSSCTLPGGRRRSSRTKRCSAGSGASLDVVSCSRGDGASGPSAKKTLRQK